MADPIVIEAPISGTDLPTGSDVFGPLPRILAAVGSGGAALIVLGGAVLSAWRVLRGRERTRGRGAAAHPKRLALGNALIAAGTLVLGASGTLNGRLGASTAFAITLTVGIRAKAVGLLPVARQHIGLPFRHDCHLNRARWRTRADEEPTPAG